MKYSHGFSIIECIIILLISGILSTIVIPNYAKIYHFAKNSTLKQQVYSLQLAVETYFLETGTYPQSIQSIDELIDLLRSNTIIKQPITNPFTSTPFTQADESGKITYSFDSNKNEYILTAYGIDNSHIILEISN